MSIDLFLRSPTTKTAITTLLTARGLLDATGNPVAGFAYVWWQESGKFMLTKPVVNPATLAVTTPATFLAGFVMMVRLYDSLFASDQIAGGTGEQWARSKIAQYLKNNGTPSVIGGINFYAFGGVQIFRAADVVTWLGANNMPGHEWAGGNTL